MKEVSRYSPAVYLGALCLFKIFAHGRDIVFVTVLMFTENELPRKTFRSPVLTALQTVYLGSIVPHNTEKKAGKQPSATYIHTFLNLLPLVSQNDATLRGYSSPDGPGLSSC